MPAQPLSRRVVLVAGAAGLAAAGLGGCTSGSQPPGPSRPPRPSADETARRAAATREQALADQASSLATSGAAGRKDVVVAAGVAEAAHTAHASALLEGLPARSTASASGSASGTPSATTAPTPPVTAASLARAQVVAATSTQGALGAVSGPVARLLASVAASDLALAANLRGAAA